MTVSQIEPVKNHYGNNSATTFDFDFYIETEQQLLVQHTDMDGVITTLQLGIDYSINETGNDEGSYITFPLQGSEYGVLAWNQSTDEKELLTLSLNLPFAQEFEFDISGELDKSQLERAFDYGMRIDQILKRKIERAVLVEEGSPIKPEDLIQNIYETQAAANNSVEKIENLTRQAQEAAEFARRTCFYEIITDTFITEEEQQDFILSKTADSINEIIGVNINNHNILKSKYSLKNSNTVSLISPVGAGCEIAITYLTGKLVPIGAVFTNCFEFEQAEPADVWKINHKLGRYPQVTIVDSSGRIVSGEVKYIDNQNVEIYFNGGFSGKAYLI